ncbi:hypothetical protein [Streptomyces sp. NPDC005969]|uniref:hypothetical protein n=1 Tax=Streptomyces sp. NPDC005969 TaxID=3156722 RepID=UPI0033C1F4AE
MTAAFTREDEQDGAGATPVARMPPAPAFMALAGTQVQGQHIAPRVVGQVRQDRRPGRRRCQSVTVWCAQGAIEHGFALLRA